MKEFTIKLLPGNGRKDIYEEELPPTPPPIKISHAESDTSKVPVTLPPPPPPKSLLPSKPADKTYRSYQHMEFPPKRSSNPRHTTTPGNPTFIIGEAWHSCIGEVLSTLEEDNNSSVQDIFSTSMAKYLGAQVLPLDLTYSWGLGICCIYSVYLSACSFKGSRLVVLNPIICNRI